MGIFDIYCKICGGPFYFPNELDSEYVSGQYSENTETILDEDGEPRTTNLLLEDPEFHSRFDWIEDNILWYMDGHTVAVGPYITSDGAGSHGVVIWDYFDIEDQLEGLAVHRKCLMWSGLSGQIDREKLYEDTTVMPGGTSDRDISMHAQQEFRWEDFLSDSDILYQVTDPDLDERNRAYIIRRGQQIREAPLNPDPNSLFLLAGERIIETPQGPVPLYFSRRYNIEEILALSDEEVGKWANYLRTWPHRGYIARILHRNDLLRGQYFEVAGKVGFLEISELSPEDLFKASGEKYGTRSFLLSQILCT